MHVIARGNERRPLFRDDADRERYLDLLAEACGKHDARVLAYCLMPNHVHLAMQTGSVPVSRVVHDVHSRYALYFNRRYDRSGHLFQGRFQGLLVDRDAYLLEVVRYIHRNPVKARLAARPEDFAWSSHGAYLGSAPPWLAVGEALVASRGKPSEGATPLPGVRRRNGRRSLRPGRRAPRRRRRGRRLRSRGALEGGSGPTS